MAEEVKVDATKGDGAPADLSEPLFLKMISEIDQIVEDAKRDIWATRLDCEDTRLARWDGQSSDGLKHEDDIGTPPEPFESGCDTRVRLADLLTNEDVMLFVVSALRAQIKFKGVEAQDASMAGNCSVVLRWVIRNQLGIKWIEELIKLAQYSSGDSPGLGLAKVWWLEENSLRMQTLTADELMEMYVRTVVEQLGSGVAQEAMPGETSAPNQAGLMEQVQAAVESFKAALADPETGPENLSSLLLEFFPGIRPARAEKVILELRKNGKAEFPVQYVKFSGPCLQAKRLFEDFFIPMNTGDFQQVRMWFENEWLSEPDLRERQISMEYDKTWVDEVLKHEGVAAFPDYIRDKKGNLAAQSQTYYKGLYNVVTCYFRAVNEDNVPGKYYVTLHKDVKFPAHKRRLVDYAHGKYPGHLVRREVLSNRVMDSRGISEIAGPHQGIQKLLTDGYGDNAQLCGVPMIITHGRQREGALRIGPLMELQAKRDGDYKWMQPPPYSPTMPSMIKELRRQMDEYFGRKNEEVSDETVALNKEFKVIWWLSNVREILMQIWALCQQYMPDEVLQRITNAQGKIVAHSAKDIQGNWDLELIFDSHDFDPAQLAEIATTVKDLLLAMDRDKTINPSPIVASLLWRLAPDMAEMALRPVDEARQSEIEDENAKYLQIRGGSEPELPDDGSINYQVRYDWYNQLIEANPMAVNDLAADKMAILKSRIERLGVLAKQYGENIQIGKQGGKTALPMEAGKQ